jgi:fructose-1,6-bisphosphatase/sedoheptulose 1,7-bisphosphatase-like protein
VREAGARIRTIDDGDVFGAIATAVPGTGIDLYLGSGGAPEGVLACAGLKAVGGVFMGRFAFGEDEKRESKRLRAEQMAQRTLEETGEGYDIDGVLTMDVLVRSDDVAFIATGVTDGEMVEGVSYEGGSITTSSIIMNAADKTVRFVKTIRRGEAGTVRF